jgi:phospholipid/cholesterol/gamma-HCH transport system substrate-binding protein
MSTRRTTNRGRLARFWERARSEPGLGRNLIVIAVLVALGSAVGGYFLSHQRFNPPWEDKYTLNATFEASPAISPGNGQEVRIAGVEVGDIRSASVSDDGNAVLEMRIDRDHPVYDNARVVLRPKSPLNEMYIELNPGGPPGRKLADGSTLPVEASERPVQIDELLGHLDVNTRAALTTLLSESDVALAHAPAELPRGLTEANRLLADLRPVVGMLDKRRGKVARLVSAFARISTAVGGDDERLLRLAGSLQKTLATVSGRSDNLDAALARLPGLSTKLRNATDGVTQLAGQLDPTLDSVRGASGELAGALGRFDKSVGALDGTLDVMRPVLAKAGPVVHDLRPAITDLNRSLGDLSPITQRLDPVTSGLLPYLTDLQAFVYNTNSAMSLKDANRGILRGQVNVTPQTLTGAGPGR